MFFFCFFNVGFDCLIVLEILYWEKYILLG